MRLHETHVISTGYIGYVHVLPPLVKKMDNTLLLLLSLFSLFLSSPPLFLEGKGRAGSAIKPGSTKGYIQTTTEARPPMLDNAFPVRERFLPIPLLHKCTAHNCTAHICTPISSLACL